MITMLMISKCVFIKDKGMIEDVYVRLLGLFPVKRNPPVRNCIRIFFAEMQEMSAISVII